MKRSVTLLACLTFLLSCTIYECSGQSYNYDGSSFCSCSKVNNSVCMEWSCTWSASPQEICFWGGSSVTLESGKKEALSQLKPGDRIETVLPDGTIGFDTFYAWLDVYHAKQATFLRLHLTPTPQEADPSLTLTPDHLVFVATKGAESVFAEEEGEHKSALAGQVEVGDYVWRKVGNQVVPSRVEAISLHQSLSGGTFAPATHSGTILVDGVLASNYARVQLSHRVLHNVGFGPLLLLEKVWGTSSPEQGIHWYPRMLKNLFIESGLLSYFMPSLLLSGSTSVTAILSGENNTSSAGMMTIPTSWPQMAAVTSG